MTRDCPQQRRPCLSATQPRGEGREEEMGWWCVLRVVCRLVCLLGCGFFFSFCAKRFALIFFLGVIPGAGQVPSMLAAHLA